jgi:glycosyltransferase involved in cell wall biosynthesis
LKVLVVSHPAVLGVNQLPHAELLSLGWDVTLVVPDRWKHEYQPDGFDHEVLPELAGRVIGRRVLNPGTVQRHVYFPGIGRLLRRLRPEFVFVEEEPTSLPAMQWGLACKFAGVPFALQMDENLDRPYPRVAKLIRAWTLRHAAFIAARSPAAARLAHAWGYQRPTPVVPHGVPEWPNGSAGLKNGTFTVGFAGRLVEEKGIWDLVEAMKGVSDARLLLVGNGPLAGDLRKVGLPGDRMELRTDMTHERMPEAYGELDVLVLPSRTTPTWAEQFGRVLVEAMWCGVPVVGSDSGEIPWVIKTTGGGVVFEEGDVEGLRRALLRLRDQPAERMALAKTGRAAVENEFSVRAAARELDAAMRSCLNTPAG